MSRLPADHIFVGWDVLPPLENGSISESFWRAYPIVLKRSGWTGRLKLVKYQGICSWKSREKLQEYMDSYWIAVPPQPPASPEFIPAHA